MQAMIASIEHADAEFVPIRIPSSDDEDDNHLKVSLDISTFLPFLGKFVPIEIWEGINPWERMNYMRNSN
jgi:hypothetical protein